MVYKSDENRTLRGPKLLNTEKSKLLGLAAQKIYKMQSWIGQGEITRIEGMLIIDFLLFLPCPHREQTLNFSMTIHYTISMPSEFPFKDRGRFDYSQHENKRNKDLDEFIDKLCEILNLDDPFGGICSHPPPSFFHKPDEVLKKIETIVTERNSLRKEIEEIKKQHESEINNLRKEFDGKISKLKKEIFELNETLGKNPKWNKRGNSYYRWNPDIEKEERCKVPRNFDVNKVEIDDYINEISFSYTYHDDEYQSIQGKEKKPVIIISLYEQLEKEQKIKDEKAKLSNLDIHNVKTWEDMKDYIYSIGSVPRGKHIEKMGRFIIKKHYGSGEFTAEELDREVGFKNRKTRRDYCKKFIKWGFIDETKTEGTYRIIF
jgi:hypothetical protein